jgi:hypothetical protein
MMRACVNADSVARVMQQYTHSDPWRAPRGHPFAEGHHGAERYRHAFSVTMAALSKLRRHSQKHQAVSRFVSRIAALNDS